MTVPITNEQRGTISVRASAILTATYVQGTALDCVGMRTVRLWVTVDAASAANQPTMLVLLSPGDGTDTAPAVGADLWYAPLEFDGTYTDQVLPGGATLVAGADYTKAPAWRTAIGKPLEIQLLPSVNTTDKIRCCIKVDVTGARWLQFLAADIDASGTLATMAVTATLSA